MNNSMKIADLIKENRTRCFIENDVLVEDTERLEFYNIFDVSFYDYFGYNLLTYAYKRKEELIELISKCDDIYIWTSFIGDSGELFNNMAEYVIKNNITGKRLFNIFTGSGAGSNQVDIELWKKAFENNEYYVISDSLEEMEKIW